MSVGSRGGGGGSSGVSARRSISSVFQLLLKLCTMVCEHLWTACIALLTTATMLYVSSTIRLGHYGGGKRLASGTAPSHQSQQYSALSQIKVTRTSSKDVLTRFAGGRAYDQISHHKRSPSAPSPRGLQNMNNKCYQNCVLTALMCVDSVWHMDRFEGSQCPLLAARVLELMRLARSGAPQCEVDDAQSRYFSSMDECDMPAQMTEGAICHLYGLCNGNQQDAYDFVNDLVHSLGGKWNHTVRSSSTIDSLFEFKKQSRWAPADPRGDRDQRRAKFGDSLGYFKFMEFYPPDAAHSSVQSLIDESVAWTSKTNNEDPADRFWQEALIEVGSVLAIWIKRFAGVGVQATSTKFNDAELVLNESIAIPLWKKSTPQMANFRLVSICEHSGGTLTGGHYTSTGSINKSWWKFDDARVMPVPRPETSHLAQILFYQRVDRLACEPARSI